MDNQRNILLAVVLTALILFGWDAVMQALYPNANKPKPVASAPAKVEKAPAAAPADGLTPSATGAAQTKDLKTALASGGRVPIAAPGLSGSINLTGALIDDLTANRHTATLKAKDGPARIFSPLGTVSPAESTLSNGVVLPAGTPIQHFAQVGWVGQSGVELPNASTVWTAPAGARLTPATPVTLTWSNSTGQSFSIRLSIDRDYIITATQSVVNRGAAAIIVRPFALLNRTDRNADPSTFNVHSGPIGAFDGKVDFDNDYSNVVEAAGQTIANQGRPDWIGFTDIYWMSALIPDKAKASSDFRSLGRGIFRADLLYEPTVVGPGQQLTGATRLFAGAKESEVLDRYEDGGIANFGLSIDWGWFQWFEKPIFLLLNKLYELVGNFGVAIILLTVIVRAIMFPIAQRQFASMASMKAVQPKMKEIQERYKDDRQKQQQEIMALYKREGVNPLAGCWPIFLQIPVFFALYKVLILAVEMRHKPFALWIHDLSAPDPAHILNLFGLLPFTPPSFLGIGVLAVLLGVTMYYQFKLNPQQLDPVQQQVFAIMPWMMMFVMAPFAAGLLIYWITSNILTIAQQAFLYSRHPQLKASEAK